MTLADYRRKREFTRTREPRPERAAAAGTRALFVVQLHHASRRHYDFRLQVGGALRSWAVPKGPSFDPSVKRLAAEVEDHPVSYADFEGEIPKGQHGGGHVALFDRGVWTSDGDVEAQLAKGHLQFTLHGQRLKGGWHLVRTARRAKQPEWLLFKQRDEFAGAIEADDLLDGVTPPPQPAAQQRPRASAPRQPAPRAPAARRAAPVRPRALSRGKRSSAQWKRLAAALAGARTATLAPAPFEPQLTRLVSNPPVGAEWLHELKWDGYRLLATVVDGKVRLWSRNALEWTARVPEITEAVARLGLTSAALDGELIAAGGGQKDFGALQSTLAGEQSAALTYVLFDLIHLDGIGLTRTPLLARKQLLEQLLAAHPQPLLRYSSHIAGDGDAAFALATQQSFEGIVSKRADSAYRAGRGDDWRKVKRSDSDEFAVVGYTAPRGARTGFGSLLLARHDGERGWRYAGRVGSGFNDEQMRAVAAKLAKGSATPTVRVDDIDTDLRTARWFAPRFVVEVFARGAGTHGLLRQPSLKAIRMDKTVNDLVAKNPTARSRAASRSAAADPERRLSHPERVVFPDLGITKQEVADYYASVSQALLREIAGRPLSVVRCPDGIARACFFQKHLTAGMAHVDRVRLKEESGTRADYLVVNDEAALMELVQFNALEFHPWGALASKPDRADRIVFDLDPGPGVAWTAVKDAAIEIRDLLAQLQLQSFLRVSGGKGLHVVVPLNPGCDWSLVKRFARGFAEALAQQSPGRYVATASKAQRKGRIFIDYLRNGRGATSVASYSLRARPGAPVAMPLAWRELGRLRSANAFTLRSAPRRVARATSDPWEGMESLKQNLARWSESARAPARKGNASAAGGSRKRR